MNEFIDVDQLLLMLESAKTEIENSGSATPAALLCAINITRATVESLDAPIQYNIKTVE